MEELILQTEQEKKEEIKQPVEKKEYLSDYFNWLSNAKSKEENIPHANYTAKYVLEASINDVKTSVLCDRLYNNYKCGFGLNMDVSSKMAKRISKNKSLSQPRWARGIYNPNKDAMWKVAKQTYTWLSDKDKYFVYSMYGENCFDEEFSNKIDKTKINKMHEEEMNNLMRPIKTYIDLSNHLMKLNTICLKCCNRESKYFLDVHEQNCNCLLKEVKFIFFKKYILENEVNQYSLPFTDDIGLWLRNSLASCNFNVKDYLLSTIIGCYNNTHEISEFHNCFDFVDTIIDKLPSSVIIIPTDQESMLRFGTNKNDISKYEGRLVVPVDFTDQESINRLFDILINNNRPKRISKNLQKSSEEIRSELANLKVEDIVTESKIEKIISPSENYVTPKIPSMSNIDSFINEIGEGWAIINCGLREDVAYKKNGEQARSKGNMYPYVVFRKGHEKRICYFEPRVNIFYTTNPGYRVSEEMQRLQCIQNVPYSKLKYYLYGKDYPNVTCWYNIDFPISVYITDILRNKMKYKEGEADLRVWFFDIEAEMETVNVKITDDKIDGRLRLFTIFDTYEKVFYTAVRKDNKNKDRKIEYNEFYEEVEYKGEIIKSGPFKVIVKEFFDERDMFKLFNDLMIEKDPDIITGWNSEAYDMTYMYVRSKTLGIELRNKYSYFKKDRIRNREGIREFIGCDGIIMIDYEVLYKLMQQNKKESYKLDFICESELGSNRKKNEIEISHDFMYENRLETYLKYNIVDVFRLYELELKLSYFKYQAEVIKICNISWTDIYTKSKILDGLVFNHMLKENKVVKTKNKVESVETEDDDGYEGATVLQSQPGLYEYLADLDLTSLYPHIMIRYNLLKDCYVGYTNVDLAEKWLYDRENMPYPFNLNIFENGGVSIYEIQTREHFERFLDDKIYTMRGTIYWKPQVQRSYVADILIYLMDQRGKYKKLKAKALTENDNLMYERYDVLQKAYKVLANSIYGVMGLKTYRLADVDTAASITASGREITTLCSHQISKYLDVMAERKTLDVPFEDAPITVHSLDGISEPKNRINVVYGDTDSLFMQIGRIVVKIYGNNLTEDENVKHAWNIICKTSEYVNKYAIHEILKRKGIDPFDEYEKYNFNYKTEFVYSRGLFLDVKKCYACRKILENGAPLDKNDVKGLSSVKSCFARGGRNCVDEILNYILRKYDLNNRLRSNNEIEKIISRYEQIITDAVNTGSTLIGIPQTMNDIKNYKVISSHIRGMLMYDVLFKHEFKMFEKGYEFKIVGINWDKLPMSKMEFEEEFGRRYSKYSWYKKFAEKPFRYESIVIPIEETKLDTSIFKISLDDTLDSCIYKRIEKIVGVIGITALTKEQKMAELAKQDIIIL